MRKKRIACAAAGILAAGMAMTIPVETMAADPSVSYDQVATSDEMTAMDEVGVEGMTPIYAKDVVDGVYDIEVEASSSMFRVVACELTVADGEMTAVMTMSGTGYLCLYMGTGAEAAASDSSAYISYVENAKGEHTFTVPVEALDQPIACAAFSKNREKWYDRALLFEAESLPESALLVDRPDYDALRKAAKEKRIEAMRETSGENGSEAKAAGQNGEEPSGKDGGEKSAAGAAWIEMEDGEYAISVALEGGSGRSAVTSPCFLIVEDGKAYARIQWSSSNYDYMIVGGEKYLPLNEEGNSTFCIPITVFNEPMAVIADTTAMSTPHEVEYTLTFDAESITDKNATPQESAKRVVYMVIAIIAVCVAVSVVNRRRRNRK